MCCYIGVSPENINWYITFWCHFFTVEIIDCSFDVLSIKIFKRKHFWMFKRTFYSQKYLDDACIFLFAFSTGPVSSIKSVNKLSSFSIFNSLITLLKVSLKIWATSLKIFFTQNILLLLHSKYSRFRRELFWSLSNNFYLKIKSLLSSKRFYCQLSYWCQGIHNISAKTQYFNTAVSLLVISLFIYFWYRFQIFIS